MPENHSLDDLEARVAKMRALGVTKWGDIELGPEPAKAADEEATQRRLTPEQQEAARRDEHRRVALAASGGPVPRLVAK